MAHAAEPSHIEESRRKGQLSTTVGPGEVSNTQAKTKTWFRGAPSFGVRFTQGMDGLLGVAGTMIHSYYGSFPHSLRETHQ